jgi:hypothetical protein
MRLQRRTQKKSGVSRVSIPDLSDREEITIGVLFRLSYNPLFLTRSDVARAKKTGDKCTLY